MPYLAMLLTRLYAPNTTRENGSPIAGLANPAIDHEGGRLEWSMVKNTTRSVLGGHRLATALDWCR
jgi:hypothetical protein